MTEQTTDLATEVTTEALPTVHQAWAAVMADLRELAKGDRNQHQGFNFRGIDAVMNAAGPSLRRHQVAVVPSHVDTRHRDVQTTKGKASRECIVVVTFTVYGPAGDSFTGMAPGESLDTGDKSTPKAMSVALRTFMLQALCLPTQDTDPDAESFERTPPEPEPDPRELVDQVLIGLRDATTEAQAREWGNRAHGRGLLDRSVTMPIDGCATVREAVAKRIEQLAPEQPTMGGSDDREAVPA